MPGPGCDHAHGANRSVRHRAENMRAMRARVATALPDSPSLSAVWVLVAILSGLTLRSLIRGTPVHHAISRWADSAIRHSLRRQCCYGLLTEAPSRSCPDQRRSRSARCQTPENLPGRRTPARAAWFECEPGSAERRSILRLRLHGDQQLLGHTIAGELIALPSSVSFAFPFINNHLRN